MVPILERRGEGGTLISMKGGLSKFSKQERAYY